MANGSASDLTGDKDDGDPPRGRIKESEKESEKPRADFLRSRQEEPAGGIL